MSSNTELVRTFCQAWSRLDPAELAGFFTEDGIYHNMPAGPIQGRAEIETFIRGFAGSWTKTEWEILELAETGHTVIAQRIDRTEVGDKKIDLPCTGVLRSATARSPPGGITSTWGRTRCDAVAAPPSVGALGALHLDLEPVPDRV